MAGHVVEILNSQEFDNDLGELVGRRQFIVYEDDQTTAATTLDTPLKAVEFDRGASPPSGWPIKIGDPWAPAGAGPAELTSAKATKFEVRASDQRAYTWEVVWHYRYPISGGGTPGPGDTSNSTISMTFFTEFEDAWRESPTIPAGQTTGVRDNTEVSDIQGFPIDSAGEPSSIAVQKGVIRISQFVDPWTATLQKFLMDLVNRRNSDLWLGVFGPGTVLYLGAEVEASLANGNLVATLHHEFAYDEYKHFRQTVWRIPSTGKPQTGLEFQEATGITLIPTPPDNIIYWYTGYPVQWIQPFPQLTNFTDDFGIILP